MTSMIRDCTSMKSPYLMRSQKCTYAMDTAKNTTVTAIQRMSCIEISRNREMSRCRSQRDPLASPGTTLCGMFELHLYELSWLPGWFEFRKMHYDAGRRSLRLIQQG